MDSININNCYDRQLFVKRIDMTEKDKKLRNKIGKKAYREKWEKEMNEFLAKLRKKNGTTEY